MLTTIRTKAFMRPMLKFFSITYVVTWTCFFAAGSLSRGTGGLSPVVELLRGSLFLLGTITPSLVALGLTALAEGRQGALALFQQIMRWDVKARWYVFALGYMVGIKLAVAALHHLITGEWPQFGQEAWFIMAGAILISTWVQAGEEIGWRAYALPRLAKHLGLSPASILLGLIWSLWHLPLFAVPGTSTTGQSFPVYLLQVTALSVSMAWLYWRTNGSLLLVMILHAAVNNTKDIVPSAVEDATNAFALSNSLIAWLTVGLMWLAAVYFLISMRKAQLAIAESP